MNKLARTLFFISVFVMLISLYTQNAKGNIISGNYEIIIPHNNENTLPLKGQLHAHSQYISPENVVTYYKDNNYDFITLTDHDAITVSPNIDGITWIGKGIEETWSTNHFTVYDVESRSAFKDFIDIPNNIQNVQNIINYYKSNNNLISIAHPSYAGNNTLEGVNLLENYNLIEIYNGVVDGSVLNAYTENYWDYILSHGKVVYGTAVDDFHICDHFGKGWVVVFVNENTKENILNSLRNGDFYASTGNDITVSYENMTITASSTQLSTFDFIGKDGVILKRDPRVFESSYEILGDEMYVRVRAKNEDGKYAWSQPAFIKGIHKLYLGMIMSNGGENENGDE